MPKLGKIVAELSHLISSYRVIYTEKVRMEVDICPSCRSNALSMGRQQVDENRCIQRIECDQCAFHMEERWIAVNFHSIFHNQNIVEDILRSKMAVMVLDAGDGIRFIHSTLIN